MAALSLAIVLLFGDLVIGSPAAFAEISPGLKAYDPPREDSIAPLNVVDGRNFWAGLNGRSALDFRYMAGGEATFGVQFLRYFTADLRGNFSTARYGGMYVELDPNYDVTVVPNAVGDPNSEINRARALSDSWRVMYLQPGLGTRAHIFPGAFPLMTQKARFGVGFGNFSDLANAIEFSGLIWSFEGGIEMQLGANSRFAVELGAGWTAGHLSRKDLPGDLGMLPVSWFSFNVGVLMWLF